MSNVIKLFKNGVPSQRKFYSRITENRPDLQEFTYKQLKRQNYELMEVSNYLKEIDIYNKPTNAEIENIFKYLLSNMKYEKYSSLKKVINTLNELNNALVEKRNKTTDISHSDLSLVLDNIVSHICTLKKEISKKFNYNMIELENVIKFEKVSKEILNPENYNEYNVIGNILDNLEILSFHDIKQRNFGMLLYSNVLHAKMTGNVEKIEYYRKLITYASNIKTLNISNDVYELLDISFDVSDNKISALDEKIISLDVDPRTGRYIIKDFIVSIDNDDTVKIDDALSIEVTPNNTYLVGIHITDVYSLGIYANELLNCKRTSEHVCKIKASLKEFQKKNCISLFLEMNNKGFVLNHKVLLTRIEVDRNLLYDEVSRILEQAPDSEYTKTILNLTNLYNIIENKKFPLFPSKENLPHLIVQKLMMLYGCIISDEFYRRDIPGLHLTGSDSYNFYTINHGNYDTGFNQYNTYSKSTKPLYDQSSILCQYIMHQCMFSRISDEDKLILTRNMQKVAEKLNKKTR